MTAPDALPRTPGGLREEVQDLQRTLQRYAEARHPRPDLVERLGRAQALLRAQERAVLDEEAPLALLCPGCGSPDACRADCPTITTDAPEGLF